ncbi:Peroxisomal acyl-coenzyme A oxidase 1 [Acorus calamus]|uniref:Peroxisomal acyl-coenzyme A oxidase 1 n=1 Tax=Acorus calamus TaxID=4465 RepID=A0AAV9E316_ACOCL|nr:Peroxisomal acyl-coenzyme A oxidase 1 [Acorus calamus]
MACLDHGFFYLINHGIDDGILKRVFEESRSFFCLPLQEKMKMKIERNSEHRGYTPLYSEILEYVFEEGERKNVYPTLYEEAWKDPLNDSVVPDGYQLSRVHTALAEATSDFINVYYRTRECILDKKKKRVNLRIGCG